MIEERRFLWCMASASAYSIPDLRRLAFERGVLTTQRTHEELLSAVKSAESKMDAKGATDAETVVIPLYVPGQMTTPTISALPATCPTGTIVQANIIPIPLSTQVSTIGSRAAGVPSMAPLLGAMQKGATAFAEDFNQTTGSRVSSMTSTYGGFGAESKRREYAPPVSSAAADVKGAYPPSLAPFGMPVQPAPAPSQSRIAFKRATPRSERLDIETKAGVSTRDLESLLKYSGVKKLDGNAFGVSTPTLDWISQQSEEWFVTACDHLGLNPIRNMADSIGILFYLNFFDAPIVLSVSERRRIK